MTDKFQQSKKDTLSRRDKSYVGQWDNHILELCNKINSFEDYYTTSSCSGRIVLIVDQTKKQSDLFVKVYHDKINFEELKRDLDGTLDMNKNIKFKLEPCALHVACRTLKDAQELYDKAKLAGWKRSGIIATNKRFMVELNSTEKLEFPIIRNKKILVDDEFLRIVLEDANKKLEKSWKKIEKLNHLIYINHSLENTNLFK